MWLATLGFFGGFAGVAIFSPLVPEFKDKLALSAFEAGLLASVPLFTGSVIRMPFGAWVDRSGGRKPFLTLLAITLAGTAGLIGLIAARWPDDMQGTYPIMLLLGIPIGCGIASFSVGIGQVAYWWPKAKQGGPLGIYAGLGNTAPALSSLLLPIVIAAVSIELAYSIWWIALAAITVVYFVWATDAPSFQLRHQGVDASPDDLRALGQDLIPAGSAWGGLARAARTVETWPLVYFYFISFGGFLALTVFFPIFWDERYDVSKGTRGLLTAVFVLITAVIRAPGGMLSDRLSIRWALLGNFVLIGAGTIVMAFSATLEISIAAMVAIAVGMGLQNAIVFKLVPHYVPGAVGGASGWIGGIGAFSGFLLPPIMGLVAGSVGGSVGYSRAFLVMSGLVALGVVVVGWLTQWSWKTEIEPARRPAPLREISVVIPQPSDAVWSVLVRPEGWYEGFRRSLSSDDGYPAPGSHNDHVYRTRIDENVAVEVTASRAPEQLEERHEGRTFTRRISYRLEPADGGTRVTVDDEIEFKGLARLAAPLALHDVQQRWARSIDRLAAASVESAR
jgi:MFS transporter, NNP family, nitrate/nitrite transporter